MGASFVPAAPRPKARAFSALRHRDFRLLWGGLLLSLTGSWLQQLAGPWLVYRLTDSPLMLGLVSFLPVLPAAPLALVAGPLIDRFPRRTVLLVTQVGLLLPPLALALLTWTGRVQVWHVILAEVLRGILATFDQPAKQVAVVEMTGREDVGSAVALWNAAINTARVIGPLLAGGIVVWIGEGWCFFLNGLSFLAVIAALLVIRLPAPDPAARRSSLAGSMVRGWQYVVKSQAIVAAVLLVTMAGLFVRPFQTLLPVFARDTLASGASGLGLLTAASGLGALLGALVAAGVRVGGQKSFLLAFSLILPLVTAAFAFSRWFLLSCGLALALGGCLTAVETAGNALVLMAVDEQFRGRVMTLFTALSMGAPRIGGLQAGWLADRWGAPLALGLGAAVSLVCAGVMTMVTYRSSRIARRAYGTRNTQHATRETPTSHE